MWHEERDEEREIRSDRAKSEGTNGVDASGKHVGSR